MIKLDIEGAEPEALEGAASTISEYRPQLAISIYRWPAHMWEIPELLFETLDDYSFYLRHYSYGMGVHFVRNPK